MAVLSVGAAATWNHPAIRISRVLKSKRISENAGRILGPMLNTMVAKKPTVNAWRDAPQIP
jgi:hypothetical protein